MPIRVCLLLAACLLQNAAASWDDLGPLPAGERFYSGTISFDGAPAFPHLMHIWYPAERAGADVPVATEGGPFPLIVFQHAGGSDYSWYDYQFERLASHGLIVMSIRHDHASCPIEFWECHRQLYTRTIDLVLEDWNETPDNDFFQRIDPERLSLAGHSHGAAFIAARDYRPMNPDGRYEISSLCLIAPCPEVPIVEYAETFARMPALQVIYGSKDEDGCTSGGQSTAIFETADRPRHFAYVIGANHWVFAERGSLGQSTISRLDAWRASAASMAAFHALILNGDESALPALRGHEPLLDGGPEVRYQFLEPERLVIDDFEDAGSPSGFSSAIVGLPGQTYVNGFLGDTFVDFDAGVSLVRNEIRDLLPPEGAPYDVLFYEDFALGPDVYIEAVERERSAGLIGKLVSVSDPAPFSTQIVIGDWDLIVAAQQNGSPTSEFAHDGVLAAYVHGGGKAILADFRYLSPTAAATLAAAGAPFDGATNWSRMTSGSTLFDGELLHENPGWGIWTYGLEVGPGAVSYAVNQFPIDPAHDERASTLGYEVVPAGMRTFQERFLHVPSSGLYHLTWGLEFAWSTPGAAFTHRLAPDDGPGLDVRGWRDLSFRIAQLYGDPLNPLGLKNLRVRLEDGDGDTAALTLGDATQGALRPASAPSTSTDWKTILETYRLSLEQFTAVNPDLDTHDLHALHFVCNVSSAGRCFVDDLEFTARIELAGDVDDDGDVDFGDVLALLAAWGTCPLPPETCAADLDGDGTVGFADLLGVLSGWTGI